MRIFSLQPCKPLFCPEVYHYAAVSTVLDSLDDSVLQAFVSFVQKCTVISEISPKGTDYDTCEAYSPASFGINWVRVRPTCVSAAGGSGESRGSQLNPPHWKLLRFIAEKHLTSSDRPGPDRASLFLVLISRNVAVSKMNRCSMTK